MHIIAPITEKIKITQARIISISLRSPHSLLEVTSLSITIKDPEGRINAMTNAILDPIKLK